MLSAIAESVRPTRGRGEAAITEPAILAFIASAAAASLQPPTPAPAATGSDYVIEQLTPRTHYLRQEIGVREAPSGNVAIFEQSDGYVVVDTGQTHRRGERIADHIEAFEGEKPVKAIVFTHWHGDHPLGAAGLLRRWPGAVIISSHRTREEMADRYSDQYPMLPGSEELKAYRAMISESRAAVAGRGEGETLPEEVEAGRQRVIADLDRLAHERPGQTLVLPSMTFARRLVLHDSENPLELLFLGRANTDGDIVVWSPRDKVVAAGDIVVWPMPYAFGSYPSEWVTTLGRIRELDFAYLVPGHGEAQRDHIYVERLQRLIAKTERQISELLDQGVDEDAVTDRLQIEDEVQAFAGDNLYHRQLFRRYFVEPMVENVVRARKGAAE